VSQKPDLLHCCTPSQRNTQQTPQTMQQGPQQARNRQASLKALAEGILGKAGRNNPRNNDATRLLHAPPQKSEELQQQQQDLDALPDPQAEDRRQRVLKMLADNPTVERAVYCQDDSTDPVILTVAVRGKGTLEVLIPKARYDGVSIIELTTTEKRCELAVIEGGKR
jgi:hypothetical protein